MSNHRPLLSFGTVHIKPVWAVHFYKWPFTFVLLDRPVYTPRTVHGDPRPYTLDSTGHWSRAEYITGLDKLKKTLIRGTDFIISCNFWLFGFWQILKWILDPCGQTDFGVTEMKGAKCKLFMITREIDCPFFAWNVPRIRNQVTWPSCDVAHVGRSRRFDLVIHFRWISGRFERFESTGL